MNSDKHHKRDSSSIRSFKKFGEKLSRAFSVDSTKPRSLSLPHLIEEEEFWNIDSSPPIYENTRGLDCTSLFNYNLEEENIYDDPNFNYSYRHRKRSVISADNSDSEDSGSIEESTPTELSHEYAQVIVEQKESTENTSSFYCPNLVIRRDSDGPLYEDCEHLAPSQPCTNNQSAQHYSENLNLVCKHSQASVESGGEITSKFCEQDFRNSFVEAVVLSNEKGGDTEDQQINYESIQQISTRTTSITSKSIAVSEIKKKFETKPSTREQILNRYNPKPRRITINRHMMNNGTTETPKSVKDIRNMFENSSPNSTKIKITNADTPKTSRPASGVSVDSLRPVSGVSINSNILDRLDPKRGSVASSVTSDMSSDEDESHDPQIEPDTEGEEERDELVEEEMKKRKEETLAEKNRRKRFKIAEELYTTEEAYYQTLVLIHVNFRQRLQNEDGSYIFPESTIREMFINTEQLHDLHKHLRDKLKDRIDKWQYRPRIGDIMKDIAPYFQLYTDYMAKFEMAVKSLNELCSKNEKFLNIIHSMEADPVCKNLKISQHMLGPVQRIPRYRMLLEDYIKHLETNSPDYPDVKKSLDQVALAANKANDNITKLENFQLVSQLLRSVSGLGGLDDLSSAQSTTPVVYIKHGHIKKMSRRRQQDRFLFLFSDVLLICKIEGHGKYKCNKKIHVHDLRSVQESDDPNMSFPFEVITKRCSFMLGAKDLSDKDAWMAALLRVLKGHEAASHTSPQRLGLVAPVWIPDNGVSMCMGCERSFTAILRRHHCRACGKVYCSLCSSNKVFLSFDNKIGRACDTCYNILHSRDFHATETKKKRGLTVSSFYSPDAETTDETNETISRGQLQSGEISGYLMVKLKDKDYLRYWCVVREHILYFYAGTYDKKPKKSTPLLGWTIAEPEDSDKMVENSYILKIGHHNVEPFYLKFGAESEKEHWYDALSKSSVLT